MSRLEWVEKTCPVGRASCTTTILSVSASELEQARSEEVVQKVQREAKIKEIKAQIQAARARRLNLNADVQKYKTFNQRLGTQIQVGEAELASQ